MSQILDELEIKKTKAGHIFSLISFLNSLVSLSLYYYYFEIPISPSTEKQILGLSIGLFLFCLSTLSGILFTFLSIKKNENLVPLKWIGAILNIASLIYILGSMFFAWLFLKNL